MRRREFIAGLGGAAAWPVVARAQQRGTPAIGFLRSTSPSSSASVLQAFRRGLGEEGYVEGQNATIEYRWAEGQFDRLAALAGDLIQRRVAVAVANLDSALAAKAATATIPIVFVTGSDPVKDGLVASLNKPGGNATGVSFLVDTLGPKKLELAREVVPNAATIAVLVNANSPAAWDEAEEVVSAANSIGQQTQILKAGTQAEIESAFATIVHQRAGALLVAGDAFMLSQRNQIVALAARSAVPTIYFLPEFVIAGGLMSYGTSIADAYRRAGLYAGRILKGEQPADLPVQQSTKVELVINLKTAKSLGLVMPLSLLGRADEVIE